MTRPQFSSSKSMIGWDTSTRSVKGRDTELKEWIFHFCFPVHSHLPRGMGPLDTKILYTRPFWTIVWVPDTPDKTSVDRWVVEKYRFMIQPRHQG